MRKALLVNTFGFQLLGRMLPNILGLSLLGLLGTTLH
jgi:hypothetical protein